MPNSIDYLFWGEHEHGVDDKGRLVMPQDFRGSLGDEFVVTRGPDKAILVFPKPVWDEIEQRLQVGVLQRQTGFLQRMLGGRSIVKLDPQFRLAIPKHLRDWARIDSSHGAVLIGQGPKIEIWNKDVWDAYNNDRFTYENMYDAAEAVGLAAVVVAG
jgi:MraZ protein